MSEGKNDPIYNAHSYHTKVPHKAIMRYILHYTEPGDVVYDGFCGTGMTGVAAQMCGNQEQVESLGFRVSENGSIEAYRGPTIGRFGARKAVISDLSPAATFIAHNYNDPANAYLFKREAMRILDEVCKECGWMYETAHTDGQKGQINYTIWSEVFSCPTCSGEIVFAREAIDQGIKDEFQCMHCRASVNRSHLELLYESRFDAALGITVRVPRRVPVLINYSVDKARYQKRPDGTDLEVLERIERLVLPNCIPTTVIPDMQMMRVGRMQPVAITHIHQFFIPRTVHILAAFWSRADVIPDRRLGSILKFWLESQLVNLSVRNRYRPEVSFPYNPLTGVFYVPSMVSEASVFTAYSNKLKRVLAALATYSPSPGQTLVETSSATALRVEESSIDYIFTDPPFGENIYYSDLNFFTESWFGVFTNAVHEAIVDRVKRKTLGDYQSLMHRCFAEYYRVLKPGRWMTVEFHNSQNSVWNSIQEALQRAGFVIADVRTLDKQQGSFQQVTSAAAVKQDLVISAYKPTAALEQRFRQVEGRLEGVNAFVRQHLQMLPVAPLALSGKLESTAERTNYVLFDRMVAYHLQRGARIHMSAADFYAMLDSEFVERDGMYFLPDQAARYDAVRARTDVEPLSLFVKDEKTAVQWVRTRLHQQPQTVGDLTPKLMQELQAIESYENLPELRDILKENFIQYDDGKWRVPDPKREKDIEAIRRKNLLKIFEGYAKERGQLKSFRKEAVIEGFKHCWQTKQYGVIVLVCEKIPAKILQEVPEFVQFYDIAKDLAPEQLGQLDFTWEA